MLNKDLKFWGHNAFSVVSDKTILFIDPWFSNSGAFFGSWFQYPKNHHLAEDAKNILETKTNSYIFISHEHQDHFDKEFLRNVPSKCVIIIPNYVDKIFRDECAEFGHKVIEVSDSKEINLSSEIVIKLMISDIGINHDAAILVKTKNLTFFNQNDCKVFDRLNEISEKIDVYSVQFSGATWHPSNFVFSDKRKKIISKEKVKNKLNNVLSGIKILKPKYFLPAAGPAVFPFLDNSLSFGADNIFIHQDYLDKFLKENKVDQVVYLTPGDTFNTELTNPIEPPASKKEIEAYKKTIVNVWDSLSSEFSEDVLKEQIQLRLNQIKKIDFKKMPILIFNYGNEHNAAEHLPKDKLFIDIQNNKILDSYKYDSDFIEVIADKKYFNLMCSERWQNVYLSLRAKVIRRPDKFNNDLNIFLFSDITNIKENYLMTRNISSERVVVTNKFGERYEIDRFCPHQGADLCNAEIDENNFLICPRHGWRFDISNEGVDTKSNEKIYSKKI